MFFFFKQKTAYEMRISDWSSDVCSSDLAIDRQLHRPIPPPRVGASECNASTLLLRAADAADDQRSFRWNEVPVRPCSFDPESLASAVACGGRERPWRPPLLPYEQIHIFGFVTRFFAGLLGFYGNCGKENRRHPRLPQVIHFSAVIQLKIGRAHV